MDIRSNRLQIIFLASIQNVKTKRMVKKKRNKYLGSFYLYANTALLFSTCTEKCAHYKIIYLQARPIFDVTRKQTFLWPVSLKINFNKKDINALIRAMKTPSSAEPTIILMKSAMVRKNAFEPEAPWAMLSAPSSWKVLQQNKCKIDCGVVSVSIHAGHLHCLYSLAWNLVF